MTTKPRPAQTTPRDRLPRGSRERLVAFLFLALSFSGANWLGAQNLLPNATFDTDLSGWSPGAFVGQWSPEDADGSSTSGSGFYFHETDAGGEFLISVCIPVAAGSTYDLRADMRLNATVDNGGLAAFVRSFATANCSSPTGHRPRLFRILGRDSTGLWSSYEGEYTAEAGTASVQVEFSLGSGSPEALEAYVDNVVFCVEGTCEQPGGGNLTPCVADAQTACLLDGRFEVSVAWSDFDGGTGSGSVMEFETVRAENDESAFFWFFKATNFEMGVKMVDACDAFGNYWVFVSGLTNVAYQVRVRDTETGTERAYSNALGRLPTTEGDTSAFGCD